MPTKKGPARIYKLPRLLDNSPNLVAMVNEQYEVVYANEACCQWLEVAAEKLIGTVLQYSRADTGDAESCNGICPSPRLFSGECDQETGYVHRIQNGVRVFRAASFSRIETENEERTAVLVVADRTDSPLPENDGEKIDWHQLLATLQKRQQQIFKSDSLAGTSDQAIRVRRQVQAVAANDADCLIIGPPGSGREHVARTIFHERDLANVQLVPVHCAIADSEQIQNAIKNWVFERRNNQSADVLLLLDIDGLSVDAQSELLGYTRLPDFEMPIMATASHDLKLMASQGEFSQSLAFHLSIQTIELTPLASRIEDVPLLIQAFIEDANRTSSQQVAGASEEVLATMKEYDWPRNVAELKQCIDAAHEQCTGSTIQLSHLPEAFNHALSASRIGYHNLQPIDLTQFLEGIEKELITRALAQSGNNKTKASQLLGISRARLLRRSSSLEVNDSKNSEEELIDESEFKEADDQ